jgi:hypothetical protein
MAEACTVTGGCKLGPRSKPLGRKGTGAATPKFRLAQSAGETRDGRIRINVSQLVRAAAVQMLRVPFAYESACPRAARHKTRTRSQRLNPDMDTWLHCLHHTHAQCMLRVMTK